MFEEDASTPTTEWTLKNFLKLTDWIYSIQRIYWKLYDIM